MTALTLYRTDPGRNMARYYHLEIQTDLFGSWCLVREWGRIGRADGQRRSDPYLSPAEASAALDRLCEIKRKRGYRHSATRNPSSSDG